MGSLCCSKKNQEILSATTAEIEIKQYTSVQDKDFQKIEHQELELIRLKIIKIRKIKKRRKRKKKKRRKMMMILKRKQMIMQ